MPPPMKKAAKSKFLTEDIEDFMHQVEYVKDTSKKSAAKRQSLDTIDENIPKVSVKYSAAKKKKENPDSESCKEVKGKLLEVMDSQIDARKHINQQMLKSLSEVMSEIKADCTMLKNNHQKLQHLAGALMKCMEQATIAQEEKLKALNDVQISFKKQVQGLIAHKGLKADDRPVWFDVYEAFPPITEPKFARPKPEAKPIRQILYTEDAIRAKFHSRGLGVGTVNLSGAGEAHTARLVAQYAALRGEGLPEAEVIDRAARAADAARPDPPPKRPAAVPPESATGQVLAEADLKNIFTEENK